MPVADAGGCGPTIENTLRPSRHGNASDAIAFPFDIDNHPSLLPLFYSIPRELREFIPAQTASQQQSE
jgi:hypothetical protein